MIDKKDINWTIDELFNFENGQYIKVEEFLSSYDLDNENDQDKLIELRHELEKAIQGKKQPKYGCWYCKGLAALRAVKSDKRNIYFKAIHSPECQVKSKNLSKEQILRIKYNGQQESELHIYLKHKIAELLEINKSHKKGVEEIIIDKPRKLSTDDNSKEWKKPDIFTYYHKSDNLYRIAFELQVTTTFLDVVISRQDFYKRDKSYIIWVFNNFDLEREKQRMMQLDIVISNNKNAFVINEETISESYNKKDLVLNCIYKTYTKSGFEIISEWKSEIILLSDIQFDDEYCAYFHNSDKELKSIEKQIQKEKLEIEKKRLKEAEKQKREIEEREKKRQQELEIEEQKRQVALIVDDIREKYKAKEEIPYWLEKKIEKLNESEASFLNATLSFDKNNKSFVYNLLKDEERLLFFEFILQQDNIQLNLNDYQNSNETLLVRYIQIKKENNPCKTIELFLKNGYKITKTDINYIRDKHDITDIKSEFYVINYFANLAIQLNDITMVAILNTDNKLKSFITAILSIKFNSFIDWNYNNFRSLANQIFYKYEEYAYLFVIALKFYRKYDSLIEEDTRKNGKYRCKLNEFFKKNINTVENQEILQIAFPELFNY